MTPRKLGIAAKDMAAANGLIPVIRNLPKHITPFVCAEGLALRKFDEAGIRVDVRGTVNFQQEPFDFPAGKLITDNALDGVLIGLGHPNNIERSLALAAQEAGKPVAFFEDFWGSAPMRCPGVFPNVAFVTDEYAKALAKRMYPQARVLVVGDSAAVVPTLELSAVLEELQSYGEAITYFGGGPEATTAELRHLIACLERTSGNWCFVPRFHPKVRELPATLGKNRRTYGDVWKEMLRPLGKRVIWTDEPSSEKVILASDVVVSSFSKLLTTAALAGKTVLCVWTPETLASLASQSILKEPPHSKLAVAHLLPARPVDLSGYLPILPRIAHACFKPLEPRLVVKALQAMLK